MNQPNYFYFYQSIPHSLDSLFLLSSAVDCCLLFEVEDGENNFPPPSWIGLAKGRMFVLQGNPK